MNLLKRIFFGLTAIFVLLSSNTVGFTAIAEEISAETSNFFTLKVNIPSEWSQNLDDWTIETDSDAVLYYKTVTARISEEEWGNYTDEDAQLWNNGENFEEGE